RVHPRARGGGGLGRHRGAPLLVPRSRDDPRPGRRARLHARGRLALRHGDGRVGRARRGLNAREPAATPMPTTHTLDCETVHYEWNNALVPRLEIEPGDTVVFDTRDSADGYYRPASSHADVLARGPFRGHPLTGPVRVNGARPGDVLVVEIVEVRPRASFGWTAIRPGRGLLPEAEFAKPFLQIWDLADGTHARMGHGIAVPIEPFPGVMGTALDEPGGHSTMPPRKNGGDIDVKHLVAGSTLSSRSAGSRARSRTSSRATPSTSRSARSWTPPTGSSPRSSPSPSSPSGRDDARSPRPPGADRPRSRRHVRLLPPGPRHGA